MRYIQDFLNKHGYQLDPDGVIGKDTYAAAENYVRKTCLANKFKVPTKGIVYVRTDEKLTDTFDDFGCLFTDGKLTKVFRASTTAGSYYVKNPITHGGITGTAITVAPQQIKNSHQFKTSGNWKSLWLGAPYFAQVLPVKIYRDGNKDTNIDKAITTSGLFGINLHRAGLGSIVDRWSAGCNVCPDKDWYEVVKSFTANERIDYTII